MLDYLWENLRYHNWWAYKYYLCEVLALVNVVGENFLVYAPYLAHNNCVSRFFGLFSTSNRTSSKNNLKKCIYNDRRNINL